MRARSHHPVAGPAFAVGLLAAVLAVAGWRVDSVPATGALDVRLGVVGSPEVAVAAADPVLRGRGLRPRGNAARGSLVVRNQTGATLAVGLRASAQDTDVDAALMVEVRAGDRTLTATTLGRLRGGSAATTTLAPGASRRLSVAVWVRAGAPSGYQGRSETVTLEPTMRVVGGR